MSASRLRVAIDGRRMQDRPFGGVGRYFARVVPRLADAVEVVILTDARRPPPDVPGFEDAMRPIGLLRGLPEAPWLHVAAARWLRHWDGIFHGTFNQLPLRCPVPAVVTIHDLSFEHHSEDFTPARRRWFQLQARAAARTARRILTPSEAVRVDVINAYRVDPARIDVAPNAADAVFHPRAADELVPALRDLGVPARYVVAVGGARRRGLPVAVEAFGRAGGPERDVGLVVVGPERPAAGPGVMWMGPVPDETWARLLAGAEALCYPTRFEGFGMPALEAAASGTPAVCARLPPLVEVLGDAAQWCDAPTPELIGSGLRVLLDDHQRRSALAAAALERAAAAPGWEETAQVTLRAYEAAAAAG